MELKKLEQGEFEIITDNYIIYICKEQNPHTKHYLYFVDVFDVLEDVPLEEIYGLYRYQDPVTDVFDDFIQAVEYINNNYIISEKIYNKLNKG